MNAVHSYVSGSISLERGSDRGDSTGCDDDSNVLSSESSDVDMLNLVSLRRARNAKQRRKRKRKKKNASLTTTLAE